MKRSALALAAASAALIFPSAASAGFVWSERAPGAGDLTATAQVVLDSGFNTLDGIRGTLDSTTPVNGLPTYQVDLFRIRITDPAAFSATTIAPGFDASLFLFDLNGLAVYTNDDDGQSTESALPAPLAGIAAGIYYLGIGMGGFQALDASSLSMFQAGSFTDVLGADPAAGALAGWTSMFGTLFESPVTYDIVLTGATNAEIPEPATLALLLGAGLAGWASRRNRPATARTAA